MYMYDEHDENVTTMVGCASLCCDTDRLRQTHNVLALYALFDWLI